MYTEAKVLGDLRLGISPTAPRCTGDFELIRFTSSVGLRLRVAVFFAERSCDRVAQKGLSVPS